MQTLGLSYYKVKMQRKQRMLKNMISNSTIQSIKSQFPYEGPDGGQRESTVVQNAGEGILPCTRLISGTPNREGHIHRVKTSGKKVEKKKTPVNYKNDFHNTLLATVHQLNKTLMKLQYLSSKIKGRKNIPLHFKMQHLSHGEVRNFYTLAKWLTPHLGCLSPLPSFHSDSVRSTLFLQQ